MDKDQNFVINDVQLGDNTGIIQVHHPIYHHQVPRHHPYPYVIHLAHQV